VFCEMGWPKEQQEGLDVPSIFAHKAHD
jgi:hypothetical protein